LDQTLGRLITRVIRTEDAGGEKGDSAGRSDRGRLRSGGTWTKKEHTLGSIVPDEPSLTIDKYTFGQE